MEMESYIPHSLNYTTIKHLIKTELIGAGLLKTGIYKAFSIFFSVKLRTVTYNHSLVSVYNKNQYQYSSKVIVVGSCNKPVLMDIT